MRKNTKKAVCIIFAVLLLACSFPISAFAVDPLSASVIANSFAQAITAYGASHGVSMTFDGIESGNTDQIGRSMHDLWMRFRNDQQSADDYLAIGEALMPSLFYKAEKAAGTAAVGISIAQQYMPDIDAFWNWVLSGPAEMVKVDNAYQWNSVNGQISPAVVYSTGVMPSIPYVPDSATDDEMFYNSYHWGYRNTGAVFSFMKSSQSVPVYCCVVIEGSQYRGYIFANESFNSRQINRSGSGVYTKYSLRTSTYPDTTIRYSSANSAWNISELTTNAPIFNSVADAVSALQTWLGDPTYDDIKVQPYVGDAVAKPVPIPDTDDPDYGPIPWAGGLDIPWNDTLFGDGTGALTDAQKEAISGALDQAIEDDGTLVLEGDEAIDNPGTDTDDPPSSDPDDYGVIGLENIFPFCIPFDIYNFLSALAATPTAPHFTATLQLPEAVGGAQTIDLDFDNPTFNQLAQLLRLLELLAFIVGLALLTRSMFIRG